MSWSQRQDQNNVLVTAQTLEERINMYISAMDRATAMNNGNESSQLQQDIQKLVDLMEKLTAGQVVTEQEVPPPLIITPQTDVLANPLGELSSRLAEYHKALYFAEEELSEDRMNKIQRLQRGLQIIPGLQKRAQAGFPVRADEIPPSVTIPSDDEFDPDAVKTLTSRLAGYKEAVSFASESESDRRRIPKLQSAIRTVEFLLTRAHAKRPVWKKDIPPEFDYCLLEGGQGEGSAVNKAKFTLTLRSLQKRADNILVKGGDQQKKLDELQKKLEELERKFPDKSTDLDNSLAVITRELEILEKVALAEKTRVLDKSLEDMELIEVRINEYKVAALTCQKAGRVNHTIQHWKVIKGLQALKEALDKGEAVDMTLVPPPPREYTPTSESPPLSSELSLGSVTTEAAQNTAGATAHLSPVFIKPAVETAEDKLAKKLFSYLDTGGDVTSLSSSKQILDINNMNVSVAQTEKLPKINNTDIKIDNVGSLVKEVSPTTTNIKIHLEEDSLESSLKTKVTCDEDRQTVIPIDVIEGQSSSQAVDQQVPNISGVTLPREVIKNRDTGEADSNTRTPNLSPSKSSDIYVRKTLDSVGFLSCQNVPDSLTHSKLASLSNADESWDTPPNNSTFVGQQSTSPSNNTIVAQQRTPSNSSTFVGQQGTNFINIPGDRSHFNNFSAPSKEELSSLQPLTKPGESNKHSTSPSTTNKTQVDTLLSSSTEDSYTAFPIIGLDKDLPNLDNGLSSLPAAVVPGVVTDSLTHHSLGSVPTSHTSHVALSSPAFISYQTNSTNETVNQLSNQGGMQETGTGHTVSGKDTTLSQDLHSELAGNARKDVTLSQDSHSELAGNAIKDVTLSQDSHSELAGNARKDVTLSQDSHSELAGNAIKDVTLSQDSHSELAGNARNSPDTLEFLDLMDSMAMPSFTVPGSLEHVTTSDVTLPTHQNGQIYYDVTSHQHEPLEASLSSQSQAVLTGSEGPNSEVSDSQSENNVSGLQVSKQENGYSHVPSPATSQTLYSSADMNKNFSNNELTSYVHNNFSPPSEAHQNNTVIKHTTDPKPTLLDHKPYNALNGSHSTAQSLQLLPAQGQSLLGTSSPHLQTSVSSSRSQGVSAARPANVLSYSDVAFTCLENLKYDWLLSLSKETDEGKKEEKKLKAKFELIKNMLRNGGRHTWEVYKACVEREHNFLIQQIEDLHLLQQLSDVQLLLEKKTLAERELEILRDRLPKLKY